MNRRITRSLTTMALLLVVALPAGSVAAQEKQHVSYKTPTENTKYVQQLNLDVGNVANHVVRAFEVHRTYPDNPPVINGLKLVETWERGYVDLIDGNGPVTQYSMYVMENGDKFFARSAGVVQSNGAGKVSATDVGYITGGTGKFATIQGIIRVAANIDRKTGFNETQDDIEYTIGK
jgi:hypothetical protein